MASEDLGAILQYHVVAGQAMSGDLSDGQMIETLLGPDVTVTITMDGVFINGPSDCGGPHRRQRRGARH